MQCRNCGTEIAEKAIVCYRCGTATTEPTYKPPEAGRPRSRASFVAVLVALVLAVVAVYLTRTFSPTNSGALTYVIVGAAIVIVALRGFARRIKR